MKPKDPGSLNQILTQNLHYIYQLRNRQKAEFFAELGIGSTTLQNILREYRTIHQERSLENFSPEKGVNPQESLVDFKELTTNLWREISGKRHR